jgi:hypothetical protein
MLIVCQVEGGRVRGEKGLYAEATAQPLVPLIVPSPSNRGPRSSCSGAL